MGYRFNLVVVESLPPKGRIIDLIGRLKLPGFLGRSGKHFTIGNSKTLTNSQFDNDLRFGTFNGCTIITSNYLVEDFFRPFITEFPIKLCDQFPNSRILFVSVFETINLIGFTLINNGKLQRCRVEQHGKIQEYDEDSLDIGNKLLGEPTTLDVGFLNQLSTNIFGLAPWEHEFADKVIMNSSDEIELSSDLIQNINQHLTKELRFQYFKNSLEHFFTKHQFKYLKGKKAFVKKIGKDISLMVSGELILRFFSCHYKIIHKKELLDIKSFGEINLESKAKISSTENGYGLRLIYGFDSLPHRHAKTVRDFELYLKEIESHIEKTVMQDFNVLIENINAH